MLEEGAEGGRGVGARGVRGAGKGKTKMAKEENKTEKMRVKKREQAGQMKGQEEKEE